MINPNNIPSPPSVLKKSQESNAKLRVEYLSPVDLIPYVNNTKQHGEDQISKIASSIKEFGFNSPVLMDGERGIIAGHGRVQAALKLGLDYIPCIELGHLSQNQKKAYIIADNRLGEVDTSWDYDLLSIELESLKDDGFDINLTGFDDSVILENKEGLTDEDYYPDELDDQNTVNVRGMVWRLGEHRMMCGDSTSELDMAKLMLDDVADVWLTDPPYNVNYEGKTKDKRKIQNDNMPDADFYDFLLLAHVVVDKHLKKGGVFYIWHADSGGFNFRKAVMDVGWSLKQCLIWSKNSMTIGRQDYHWMHEPCLYGWKPGGAHIWTSDRKQTTILKFDKPVKNDIHPTMKPVSLFEYLISNNTRGSDIIVDSFGGSGTTIIAAEKTQRRARVMEFDPVYADAIIQRWQDFTGDKALLINDNRTFDEMKGIIKEVN